MDYVGDKMYIVRYLHSVIFDLIWCFWLIISIVAFINPKIMTYIFSKLIWRKFIPSYCFVYNSLTELDCGQVLKQCQVLGVIDIHNGVLSVLHV